MGIDKALHSLDTRSARLASTRQVPRPMILEQLLVFTPPSSPCSVASSVQVLGKHETSEEKNISQTPSTLHSVTPSRERRCPQTPSTLWSATPYEERDLHRTPPNLCPMTLFEESHSPQPPSMLWPATPMAWPAMEQGMRSLWTKQDTLGYESIPASCGNATFASDSRE